MNWLWIALVVNVACAGLNAANLIRRPQRGPAWSGFFLGGSTVAVFVCVTGLLTAS